MLIQEGVNIDPILQSTGNSIGKSIFEKMYDDDLDIFMENIAKLLHMTVSNASYFQKLVNQLVF